MNFSLKQLEAFVQVADLGSFSKAADRLNTTQPNISSRIAALEAVLGTTLMQRDPGSVRITSTGRELLIHARHVLQAAESMLLAADNSKVFDGVLRLGVTEMVAHTWLRDFLQRLTIKFPSLSVELTVDVSITLDKALAEKSLDLAFQSGPFSHAMDGSKDLGTYELVWVAAPEVAKSFKSAITLEELVSHPILTHAKNTQPFADIEKHVRTAHGVTPRLITSNNLGACMHMTVDGMGVAALLETMAATEIKKGTLVKLNYGWVPDPLSFFARYDAERSAKYVEIAANLACKTAADFMKKRKKNRRKQASG